MSENRDFLLREEEKLVYRLRTLYSRFGYAPYRMNRFEEYDLYARNKDFLVSDDIITFTDTNGKLMALKPDVTLSIVRNVRDESTLKLYYNENVYRVSKGTRAFREMVQVGLECIGKIDDYLLTEVLMLAGESLSLISDQAVMTISHMGIIKALVEALNISDEDRGAVLRCLGEKNRHEMAAICERAGADKTAVEKLSRLAMTYGEPVDVIRELREMGCDESCVAQLERVTGALRGSGIGTCVRLDFSIVNDMGYYNGIVFKGFVPGIPTDVISGGQYDRLMRKMGKKNGAVGFAVYMDELDRYFGENNEYDVDTVLIYDESTPIEELTRAMRSLTRGGLSVIALREIPEKLRYKQQIRIGEVH